MEIIGVTHTQNTAALAELINAAYRGSSGAGRWTTEHGLVSGDRIQPSALADIILSKRARVFAAFDEGDVPRCCIVVTLPDNKGEDKRSVDFGLFAVHPDEQGNGLGKKLLMHAENYARKHAGRVRVTVVNLNKALVEFYIRRGFALTGEVEPYPVGQNVGNPLVEGIALVVLEKAI